MRGRVTKARSHLRLRVRQGKRRGAGPPGVGFEAELGTLAQKTRKKEAEPRTGWQKNNRERYEFHPESAENKYTSQDRKPVEARQARTARLGGQGKPTNTGSPRPEPNPKMLGHTVPRPKSKTGGKGIVALRPGEEGHSLSGHRPGGRPRIDNGSS